MGCLAVRTAKAAHQHLPDGTRRESTVKPVTRSRRSGVQEANLARLSQIDEPRMRNQPPSLRHQRSSTACSPTIANRQHEDKIREVQIHMTPRFMYQIKGRGQPRLGIHKSGREGFLPKPRVGPSHAAED